MLQENEEAIDADADFIAVSGESSDEEDTIMEEERLEGEIDHKRELDELKVTILYFEKLSRMIINHSSDLNKNVFLFI